MRQLHGRYQRPVFEVNEYLSSHAALERGAEDLDAVAAQVILETWFAELPDD